MNFYLTHVYRFSASHRLYIHSKTTNENFEIFDRCSNPEGHGHDYVVEVRIGKDIDSTTGMVTNHLAMNTEGIKIIENLNYKWIDRDLDYFTDKQSTVENIGVYLWKEFSAIYGSRLCGIKIWENDRSYFECYEVN